MGRELLGLQKARRGHSMASCSPGATLEDWFATNQLGRHSLGSPQFFKPLHCERPAQISNCIRCQVFVTESASKPTDPASPRERAGLAGLRNKDALNLPMSCSTTFDSSNGFLPVC